MSPVFRRIRGALGMGAIWAIAWAVVGSIIMEGIIDPNGEIVDIWPVVLAIFGFLGGLAFSVVLGVAARRRRFSELSVRQFALWGALAGVALGVFAISVGIAPLVIAFTAAGCALSAAGSLRLARFAEQRDPVRIRGVESDDLLPSGDDDSTLRRPS